jgi:cephalosporin-C deacetylase
VAQFDLPIEELERYRPTREEPDDFTRFWDDTLRAARSAGSAARFEPIDAGLSGVVVEDVTFGGFAGQPVRGWMLRPTNASAPLGCVVQFIGYNSGRGLPHQWTMLPSAGYALFVMDNRGQSSAAYRGATPDPAGTSPHVIGRLSLGIESPHTYYYRRLFTDAVRAVDAARSHPSVDAQRIVVSGGSQGGGIALAAAALADPVAAMIDFPFLCHYRRALRLTDSQPYAELALYLQTRRDAEDEVFRTLSYFDGVNFAARATAPALFSAGLYDAVCPPSTVFAAHNHYAGDKRIEVYPYNGHEGGGAHHQVKQLRFLAEHLLT